MASTRPFVMQAPEHIAMEYGGNKQRIAAAAQMGTIDPTAAVMAGMFIDRMRAAQLAEKTPQQTVAQQVMAPQPLPGSGGPPGPGAPPAPTPPPPPQGMPQSAPTPSMPPSAPRRHLLRVWRRAVCLPLAGACPRACSTATPLAVWCLLKGAVVSVTTIPWATRLLTIIRANSMLATTRLIFQEFSRLAALVRLSRMPQRRRQILPSRQNRLAGGKLPLSSKPQRRLGSRRALLHP